jgi:phosphate-selective porin OprO and OprP
MNRTLIAALFFSSSFSIAYASGGDTPAGGGSDRTEGLVVPSQAAPAQDKPAADKSAGGDIKVFWKNGLYFESADKQFKAKMGGRLLFDMGGIHTDDDFEASNGREEDGARFRTARWYLSGEFNELIEFKWQYDFAGGTDNKLKDAYIGMKTSPVGALRVGQFREPFSLEQLTSISHVTFMERSLADRLVPGRNVGLQASDTNAGKTMTWAVGVFRDDGSDTGASSGDGEQSATARVTFLPQHTDEEHLVHVGAGFTTRVPPGHVYSVASKGESGLTAQNIVSTGNIGADRVDVANLEAAWVRGPLSLQAEVIQSMVDASSGSDPDFQGWYLFASWFLTGEHRQYKDTAGAFERIKVNHPYGKDGGKGAWELAARMSSLDLTDAGINGGEADDVTLGVNWYLNPFTRVMLNYVREDIDEATTPDGTADIFQMRIAFEF